MREKVVVVGAGVGGLTAAHELVERGFEVHVYERRRFAGGKAASVRFGDDQKPGEHGFRFFPSWYRHLPDTMKRIPYRGRRTYYEGRTVYDNLVAAEVNLLTWYDRDPTPLPMHLPRSAGQFRALADFVLGLKQFGLENSEASFFLTKLATFLATPEGERVARFQGITWWEYVEAGSKSAAYQSLVSASTRTMVAAKATEACAYTIGKLALRTLFDAVSQVDRVLNGPTNEVWIEPWIEHLQNRGVNFHFGQELEEIVFEGEPRIAALRFSSRLGNDLARLRALFAPWLSDYESLLGGTPEMTEHQAERSAPADRRVLTGTAYRTRLARFKELQKNALQLVDALQHSLRGLRQSLEQTQGSTVKRPTVHATDDVIRDLVEIKRLFENNPDGMPTSTSVGEKPDDSEPPPTTGRAAPTAVVTLTDDTTARFEAVLARSTKPGATADRAKLAQQVNNAWAEFTIAGIYVPGLADQAAKLAEDDAEAEIGALFQERQNIVANIRNQDELRQELDAALIQLDSTKAFRILIAKVTRIGTPMRQLEWLLTGAAVPADYFVLALPVEQMAYYVNRSGTMRLHDPDLNRIVRLADATDWMAGVQFYLREPINLTPGHVIGMDSEWGITAIEQTQFWQDVIIPDDVKSVVSVDIAAWDRPGREVLKEAYNCTNDEIAQEVWTQLKAGLNRKSRQAVLDERMLLQGKLEQGVSFYVDDSIVDVFDRKKQGAYERARSVQFSVVASSLADSNGEVPVRATPYVWGPRLRYNAEPLLVNRVGTHALRPEARTRIPNLFLASDYVKTETDLACMEGANEAARRATNALLDAAGSSAGRCETWSFMSTSQLAEALLSAANVANGSSHAAAALKGASAMADSALAVAGQAANMFKRFWEKK